MASDGGYAWWRADDPSKPPRPPAVVERDMLRAASTALRTRSGAGRYQEGELIADVGYSVAALIDAVARHVQTMPGEVHATALQLAHTLYALDTSDELHSGADDLDPS